MAKASTTTIKKKETKIIESAVPGITLTLDLDEAKVLAGVLNRVRGNGVSKAKTAVYGIFDALYYAGVTVPLNAANNYKGDVIVSDQAQPANFFATTSSPSF